MEMIPVTSSNIRAVGFDEPTSTLFVEFIKSGRYSYAGVPREKFDQLLAAESQGKFLNSEIKPTYPALKLEAADEIGGGSVNQPLAA